MAKTKEAGKSKESSKAKVKVKAPPAKKVRQRDQVTKGPHGGVRVVLVDDVTHVGKQGQVVEVKPGYARNYLVPNGLAILPSEHNLRLLDRYKVRVEQAREARKSDLKSLAEQIVRTMSITIEANANETGDLYGSVGPADIARGMRGKNLLVEPDMIKLEEPLRHLGEWAVRIVLGYEIEAQLKVAIVPQSAGKR